MQKRERLEWVDGHLDLAYLAVGGRDMQRDAPPHAAVTLPALAEGPVTTVLGTIFVQRQITGQGPGKDVTGPWCYNSPDEAHAACLRQMDVYQSWQRAGHIKIVTQASELSREGLRVILLLEGAAGIRTVADLHAFHAAGLRAIGLAWAEGNIWAGGNNVGGPLTPDGRKLVAEIDALHMIHDVSHLSEPAFWDLMALARGPRIASHSNCRTLLTGHQPQRNLDRHLSDRQIAAIAQAGGMIGINLYQHFLTPSGPAHIADVVRHITHTAEVMGRRDAIGLGSDMDGGFDATLLPADLNHPRCLPALAEALANAGWTPAEVAGFAANNWRRFLNDSLRD